MSFFLSEIDKLCAGVLRSGFWLRDALRGAPLRSHYNDVKRSWHSPHSRQVQLRELLTHACKHSQLYAQHAGEELSRFPVVNKQFLIEHYAENLIAEDILPWQKMPYHIQRTSGSTGAPFAVPLDSRKRVRRLAELKFFGHIAGFNSHEKLMQLRIWGGQPKSRRASVLENITPFDISNLSDERMLSVYEMMRRGRHVALRGYASVIGRLAQVVKMHGLPPLSALKISIAGSEALPDADRTAIMHYLGGNVISQYANEENGILAQQSPNGALENAFFLNHASYVFELLKLDSDSPANDGELGRIVITDLYNYAFPFIRYDTGDCGIMRHTAEGLPYLEQIYGRTIDLIYDAQGAPLSPMLLMRRLKLIDGIRQWQFFQTASGRYKLKIVAADSATPASLTPRIRAELAPYFGFDAQIDVEYTRAIETPPNGKYRPVINRAK